MVVAVLASGVALMVFGGSEASTMGAALLGAIPGLLRDYIRTRLNLKIRAMRAGGDRT